MGALPLDLALAAVLTARLDGAARPGLLAAVAAVPAVPAVPAPRTAPDAVPSPQPAGRGS
jgi:hypothetical protein